MLKRNPQHKIGEVTDFKNIHGSYGFSIQNVNEYKLLDDFKLFLSLASKKDEFRTCQIDFIIFVFHLGLPSAIATFDRDQNQTGEFTCDDVNLNMFVPYMRSFLINYL